MLQALVRFSLRYRGVVVVLAGILLAYGFYVATNAKLDVFPDFVQPQVAIQTEAPGLSPEQVELLITRPVETMINGLGDMESLRSESIEGLSIITAVFKEGTDVFRARQMLAEKMAETAGELPAGVQTPRMTPLTSSTMDLLKIGMVCDKMTPMQLRSFADWTLKPRLLSVPGVAKCSSFGGEVRQFQIQVRPDRLVAYHLTVSEVLTAAKASTAIMGAGFVETLTGETAPVVVNIFGEDLDVLDAKAAEVAKVLEAVPGAADMQVKSPPGSPRMVVRLRPDRLTQFGFRPAEVLEAVQTAYQGTVVAQTHRGNETASVAVILEESSRRDPETIGELLLAGPAGIRVPLREMAEIYPTSGRHSIMHEGARRRQTVTCATSGRDVTSFVADARKQVDAQINFPSGAYAVFSGEAQANAEAQRQLLLHSAVAAVGILMLLAIAFGNARNLLLVLANVPFALVGGILAVWLTKMLGVSGEGGLTIGALVGFVTLFGITTRNSIMMISHFEHLVEREGMTWGLDAAIRGASERLIPVLMTAAVTALGLLPLALGTGEAGREIEGPMAIVILGGLVTSTALNLFVLPTLALRYGRFVPQPDIEER